MKTRIFPLALHRAVKAVLVVLLCAGTQVVVASKASRTAKQRATVAKKAAKMKQYKRVHQHAMNEITSGNPAKAVPFLTRYAELKPTDAETYFMLALARAQQGEKEKAVAAMRKALSLGLAPSRVVAGPRDLLGPLAEPDALRRLLADHPDWLKTLEGEADSDATWQPVHGPMVGSVTDESARVWVRTARPGGVRAVAWEIDRIGGDVGRVVCEGKARATAERDFTAVVQLEGLKPDRLYAYSVGPEGAKPAARSDRLYFRTAPPRGKKTSFTLAFGGGAGYVPENERMWLTVNARKPDVLLMLGDNVYIDNPKSPHMQRYCYYRRQSRPEWRTLVAHTAVYSIWDDHDFGTNDCWGGPEIDSPSWKRPVWNVFRQNWVNPGYAGGEKQPGCWYAFHWNDVDFFMLDCRYYRTNPKVENPSMLGPVQKAWLKDRLGASKATFKVICSSVPVDFRTKGDSLDTWNGFRAERAELFGFIDKRRIEGVVFMSADRHRSDLWKIPREGGYPFYEFNSSRFTNQHVHGTMAAAEFSYNKKQSFGLVRFDMTAADPTATYNVVTIDNEIVHSFTVKRSRLAYR